jgi:hypothetical protein
MKCSKKIALAFFMLIGSSNLLLADAAEGAFFGGLTGAAIGGMAGGGRGAGIGALVGMGTGAAIGAASDRNRGYYDDGDVYDYETVYYTDINEELARLSVKRRNFIRQLRAEQNKRRPSRSRIRYLRGAIGQVDADMNYLQGY